uniref:Putative ovule protein n=1 Tax=Solanum chacoense TaxID=4108 RepID=A0A0V0IFL3_SOLCH
MLEGSVVTSTVNGVELVFDSVRLGEIFHIPTVGLSEYVWTRDVNCLLTSKFSQGRVTPRDRKVLKGKKSPFHKLMFELVHKGILPRGERRHEASFRDMGIAHALENKDHIDWTSLMIKQMARVIDPKPGAH